MDLKRETGSRMSVLKNFFNLYAVSSFPSTHAHFSSTPCLAVVRSYTFTPGSCSVQPCWAAPAKQLGVKGILTVVVEGQIGIFVIQTFHRSRASLEAPKMSLVELNLKVQKEGIFICVVTFNDGGNSSAFLKIRKYKWNVRWKKCLNSFNSWNRPQVN